MDEREKDIAAEEMSSQWRKQIRLNALAAQHLLGWEWFLTPHNQEQTVLAPSQEVANTLLLGQMVYSLVPDFGNDQAAASLLEDEIERRELKDEYLFHLRLIILRSKRERKGYLPQYKSQKIIDWGYVRATPAQRRDAALLAVGVPVEA